MIIAPFAPQPDTFVGMPQEQPVGRIPYITIQGFCETSGLVASLTKAVTDRRLSRAKLTLSPGGIQAAVKTFSENATPDLLMIEIGTQGEELFASLGALAEVCDTKTKVVLVGEFNDISLYRRLMERGITEYLTAPVDALTLIGSVLRLFPQNSSGRLGRVLACIGAKGGTGSSTTAQNVAWSLAERGSKVMLADLDLQFGTAALNYNIESSVGFAEQLGDADRLDDALFERLLYKRGPDLSILAGATATREVIQPDLEVLDRILDLARATFPFVVLDLPHQWSPWVRRALLSADEVVVTAVPDLANLRNVRVLLDLLKEARPNDPQPRLVLNQVGVPKRSEIMADKFASALETPVAAKIGFEPILFSGAATSGQMIAEVSHKSAAGKAFMQLAQDLGGNAPRVKKSRRVFWRR